MTMAGWRIEVREAMAGCEAYAWLRPNGYLEQARTSMFVVKHGPWRELNGLIVWCCADPLFETIYVSREIADAEAERVRVVEIDDSWPDKTARGWLSVRCNYHGEKLWWTWEGEHARWPSNVRVRLA